MVQAGGIPVFCSWRASVGCVLGPPPSWSLRGVMTYTARIGHSAGRFGSESAAEVIQNGASIHLGKGRVQPGKVPAQGWRA